MKGIIKSGGIGILIHRTTIIQITYFLTLPLFPLLFRLNSRTPKQMLGKGFLFALLIHPDFNRERLWTDPCIGCLVIPTA